MSPHKLQQLQQGQLAALKEKAKQDELERQRLSQAELDDINGQLRAVADVIAQRIDEVVISSSRSRPGRSHASVENNSDTADYLVTIAVTSHRSDVAGLRKSMDSERQRQRYQLEQQLAQRASSWSNSVTD